MNLPQGRFERFLSEEDFLEALATSMKRPGGELVTLSRGFRATDSAYDPQQPRPLEHHGVRRGVAPEGGSGPARRVKRGHGRAGIHGAR
jgi:hypothetical protein